MRETTRATADDRMSRGAANPGGRRPPALAPAFGPQDVAAVIEGARRVLREIGMGCCDGAVRRRLAALPGAREVGERVCYDDRAVDGVLSEMRALTATAAAEPDPAVPAAFGFGGPWSCLFLADAAAGAVRPASQLEAGRMVRILEGLGASVGVTPVVPAADVPPDLRMLAGLKIVLQHSSASSAMTNPPSPAEIPFVRDMGAAVGRVPRAFVMVVVSPLRFHEQALAYYLQHGDEPGLNLYLSSGVMPCTGSTAPMHMPGAVIQALAENIALGACLQAFGKRCYELNLRCDPFDMRYGTYVIGSPEYHLLDMACRAVHRHVHDLPRRGGSFRTMAKQPDVQAAAERAFSVLFQALQGATSFGNAGQLSMDEVFSPEQAVLDREILRNVERIARGLTWREQAGGAAAVDEAVDLIRRGVAAGQFLEQEETLDGHRDFFYESELFSHENAGTWQRKGAGSILARAAGIAADAEARNAWQPDEDRLRNLEKIYAAAARHLGAK